ncbi:MAG TPA: hypothetical protein VLM11_08265 [Streptosporangiaceae bacterium]|nr:hypothetical protein [Streptosporangiaceae bacterium]
MFIEQRGEPNFLNVGFRQPDGFACSAAVPLEQTQRCLKLRLHLIELDLTFHKAVDMPDEARYDSSVVRIHLVITVTTIPSSVITWTAPSPEVNYKVLNSGHGGTSA